MAMKACAGVKMVKRNTILRHLAPMHRSWKPIMAFFGPSALEKKVDKLIDVLEKKVDNLGVTLEKKVDNLGVTLEKKVDNLGVTLDNLGVKVQGLDVSVQHLVKQSAETRATVTAGFTINVAASLAWSVLGLLYASRLIGK